MPYQLLITKLAVINTPLQIVRCNLELYIRLLSYFFKHYKHLWLDDEIKLHVNLHW